MDYKALVAQFEANGGEVTRCEEGKRSLTSKEVARAIGYERDTMIKYLVFGIAETGEEFCERVTAYDAEDAYDRYKKDHPECMITGVRESIRGQA